jgi:hypothetical protein
MRTILGNSWWAYVLWAPEDGTGGGRDTPPPADGNAPPPADGNAPWYQAAGVAPEHQDWVRNKEFADINTALASYRSLEGTIGRQRLAVPKDANDQAAYDAIYGVIGRPNDPKGYKQPEGLKIDEKVWDRFTGVFHKHGVGQAQAEAILKEYHAFGSEGQAAKDTERVQQEAREEAELKKAWGKDYDANTDIAGRAWRALGMTEELSNKLESALGLKAFTEFFHKVGSGMSEAAMKQDGGNGQGGNSGGVEAAKVARDRLLADKDFLARYQHSNQAIRNRAIEEIQPYMKIIAEAKDEARKAGREFA